MGFAETFGEVVGYSIYFVVGTIWLAFLGVGLCVVLFYIGSICANFSCWGPVFRWIKDGYHSTKSALSRSIATISRLPKTVVKVCTDGLHKVRETMTSRGNNKSNTEYAMAPSRNSSDETPLLNEDESSVDDLPETKIDIVVDPPSRNSVTVITDELPMTNYETSTATHP
ncbi:hypothetical protein BDA99DRAFT_509922 [Phascolomyces articulosus]|uniref:Uncharacterized protein n=1 Tax=Phascolomyces articulosus TaxID=60185 RepID=A0AAD5KA45_9FUNG|nr:hypothetical protein BDA99DRAFT_509922 [Phascolomyces articulosus]